MHSKQGCAQSDILRKLRLQSQRIPYSSNSTGGSVHAFHCNPSKLAVCVGHPESRSKDTQLLNQKNILCYFDFNGLGYVIFNACRFCNDWWSPLVLVSLFQ